MYGAPYGYSDRAVKRPRSDDFGHSVPGYDTRAGASNMQAGYSVQPTASLQSPPAPYGMQTPVPANPNWHYTQGSSSAPARYPESSARTAQGMTPNSSFAMQPVPMGAEGGQAFARRGTDPFTMSQHVAQTSPSTPYQGTQEAMYPIPTSASMAGPPTFADPEPVPMARQQTHSVASPTSSTRSNLNPVAPSYSIQPQAYGALPDPSSFAYPASASHYRQGPAYHPSALLTQPLSGLAIRQQQPPPEQYVPQPPQQYTELGQGYPAPSGVTYPTTQGQEEQHYR